MHRRGVQPPGQRGVNPNALQAGKPQAVPTINIPTSLARTPLSATANSPQYQSVVGQLAQSHRVLQPVAQTVSRRCRFPVFGRANLRSFSVPPVGSIVGLIGARPIASAAARHTLPKL
jgi:hypothetical protein